MNNSIACIRGIYTDARSQYGTTIYSSSFGVVHAVFPVHKPLVKLNTLCLDKVFVAFR